jgi:glycosyltransferase involved in cell wall biosynthesis
MDSAKLPLVTVGIPTYNRYPLLQRCIEHIRAQDYTNLEILISDNTAGQPVPDWIIALQSVDPRIRYVRQPQNIGMVPNEEFVRTRARGEYVCVAHDDDEFPPDHVRRLMEVLREDVGCVLAGPVCERRFEGNPWHEYERYDSKGQSRSERMTHLAVCALEDPWRTEHLFYGVYRRDALPQDFSLGSWRYTLRFLYLLSMQGHIRTVEDIRMVKNTTRQDVEKYRVAAYIRRHWLLPRLFNRRQEARVSIALSLVADTLGASQLPLAERLWLTWVLFRSLFRNRLEAAYPIPLHDSETK